jgi:hypothetical protein
LFVALACAVGLAMAASAAAHGGDAAVEILPSQAAAGDAVIIYAENLDPAIAVTVALLVPGGERLLGHFESDREGHLVAEVTLPADLDARAYELRLITGTGIVVTSLVTVGSPEAASVGAPPLLLAVVVLCVGVALVGGVLISRRHPPLEGR